MGGLQMLGMGNYLLASQPTVRLAQVLRVVDALGGTLQLTGLPGAREKQGA